jgi:hypothetical protein
MDDDDVFYDAVEYQPSRLSRIGAYGAMAYGGYRLGSKGVRKVIDKTQGPIRYALRRYPGRPISFRGRQYTRQQIFDYIVSLKKKEEELLAKLDSVF